MLTDTERKLLRILWNLDQSFWVKPDFPKLCRLSGSSEEQVRECLKVLVKEGFVEVRPGELRVLRA